MSKGLGEQLTYSGSSLDARETIILQEEQTIDNAITNISNAYPGLRVKVIERLEKSDFTGELLSFKIYEIKKTSNRNKPLPANQGGYELIQEPKDLKYSDNTSFLNSDNEINIDTLKSKNIPELQLTVNGWYFTISNNVPWEKQALEIPSYHIGGSNMLIVFPSLVPESANFGDFSQALINEYDVLNGKQLEISIFDINKCSNGYLSSDFSYKFIIPLNVDSTETIIKCENGINLQCEIGINQQSNKYGIEIVLPDEEPNPNDYRVVLSFSNIQDTSGKVDKISNPINGNLPKLDSDGNLVDSGISASSVLTQHQNISGKADKVTGSNLTNKLVTLDEDGNIQDGGITLNALRGEYVKKPSTDPTDGQILSYDETNETTKWIDNTTVHIKYAANTTPSANDMHNIIQPGDLYIGVYSDNSSIASSNYEDYIWSRIVGIDGKSAYQAAIDAGQTIAPTEAQWVQELKANFGEYLSADYGTNGYPASGGSDIVAADAEHDKIYIVPNDPTTPTANIMFVSVSNGNNGYTWINLGEVNVSGKFNSGQNLDDVSIVQNLNTGGSDKVPSAAAVKGLNEQLYGVTGAEVVDSTDYATLFDGSSYQKAAALSIASWTAGMVVYDGDPANGSKKINYLASSFEAKKSSFNHLRVVGKTSGYTCYFMFLKKVPGVVDLTFEQMVEGGYVCDGYDTSNVENVIFKVAPNVTVTKEIPGDAVAVIFSRTEVISGASVSRAPLSVVFVNIPHENGDIDDLKEQCASVEDLAEAVDKVEAKTEDIEYSETPMTYASADGYINGDTGAETESSSGGKIATVVVGSAKKIKFLGYQLTSYANVAGYCFVDGEDAVLLSSKYVVNLDTETNGETKEYAVTVPEGAVALKCSVRAADMEGFYAKKVTGNTIGESIVEAVKPVVSVVDEMEKEYETSFTYGTDTLVSGILLENNTVLPNNSTRYLDTPIAVQPGDVVQAYAYYLNNGNEVKFSTPNIQSVCCFKDGANVRYGYRTITAQTAGGASTLVEYYTVPDGVDAVKLSLISASGYSQRKIIVWRGATAKYVKVSNNDNYDQRLTVAAMEAGVEYALPYADVWSNRCIAFSAKVTRDAESGIGTLTIGNKTGGSAVAIFGSSATSIAITDTEITITGGVNGSETLSHGLIIDNDIQFIAETDRSYTQLVKVVLRSNGEEYSVNSFSKKFGQVGGERFVFASVGGVFSSVSFCNTIKDLLAPVWVFGDSYLSNNGSSRWVYWAEENNVKNFMISSFAGAKSKDQIKSFRDLMAIHRPKVLCWFLGMNDADSTGSTQSTTPNADWLKCAKEVIDTCDKYGVVVVLATIPSVKESGATAIWSNKAKNAWVKASGRRYFDEEAAVGASEDGVWISGYKESNGVHPSTKGAKALFTRLLADVPEIAFNK